MLVVLPNRLLGETIYSLGARIHKLSGYANPRETSQLFFGNPHSQSVHDLPVNLEEFARRTHGCYGTTEQLIEAASVIPFFTKFRSSEKQEAAMALAATPRA